jgi:D-glycero-D-manno-heptose 1,7-bisphosphate phosphatase
MTDRRFVILDRDGTVNVEKNYLTDPVDMELLPGAAAGLRRMRELGLGLVLITNQSAVGRGVIDRSGLDRIHGRLCALLADAGVSLDGIYVCPHHPAENCACRKPKTALVALAARELDFDPARSFVIGDKACDIVLGQRVGATTLLVLTGYGAATKAEGGVRPDLVVQDLEEAAEAIAHLLAEG